MENLLEICVIAGISNLALLALTYLLGTLTYRIKRTLRRLPYTLTNTATAYTTSNGILILLPLCLLIGTAAYYQVTTLTQPFLALYDGLTFLLLFALPGYFLYRVFFAKVTMPPSHQPVALALMYTLSTLFALTSLITYSHYFATASVPTTAHITETGRLTGLNFTITDTTPQRVTLQIIDPISNRPIAARSVVAQSEALAGTVPAYRVDGPLGYTWYDIGVERRKARLTW